MTKLSPAQVAAAARGAGFTGVRLQRAVAVALAESGGDPLAVGRNSDKWRSRDRGLWQINSHWHPEVSDAVAFSPSGAAAAAYKISNGGTSWSAWSTWHNGAAASQMGRAAIAVRQAKASGGTSGGTATAAAWHWNLNPVPGLPGLEPSIPLGPGATNPLGSLGDSIKAPIDALKMLVALDVKAAAWMSDPHNWLRVAMVAGGAVGILLALDMIAESGAGGQLASGAAGGVTKVIGGAVQAGAAVATDGASLAATKAAGAAKGAGKAATASKAAAAA